MPLRYSWLAAYKGTGHELTMLLQDQEELNRIIQNYAKNQKKL
jgi:hypothetical protein